MTILDQSISFLSGIGPERAQWLENELGISTWGDLIHYFPFRYIDKSQLTPARDLPQHIGEYVLISGIVTTFKKASHGSAYAKSGRFEADFLIDHQHQISLCWFQGGEWLKNKIHIGQHYVCFGKINGFKQTFQIVHPEMETFEQWKTNPQKWQAIYSVTEKLKNKNIASKTIERFQKTLATKLASVSLPETLPPFLLSRAALMGRKECLLEIHAPKTYASLMKAKERIKFEEVFWFQMNLVCLQQQRIQYSNAPVFGKVGDLVHGFYQKLEVALTSAQKRVIKEIRKDCGQSQPMHRLLQGDVGSGKTLVALMAMLLALDNGFQACIVAPTEVLAQQHYTSISDDCFGLPIQICLLTGSTKASERTRILEQLVHGDVHILVGTHALFEERVVFKSLGLVVIDEQHRFGVEQRAKLLAKNKFQCHTLMMTATPIPRTLAMTMYSDLQVSVIDEMPQGRLPIKTIHRWDHQRIVAYQWIKQEIERGRQAYIVYPLIEESDKLQFEDLMTGYEQVKDFFDKEGTTISFVHGKMDRELKEVNMRRFVQGKTRLMVATTVIEVGVNVPNATVMMIESSQKFGLSQLHQLRGRVGRGTHQSYCLLISPTQISEEARKRIQIMVSTNDGFVIAEKDLELRGPGDIQGTKQSGEMNFKMLNLVTDQSIIAKSKALVTEICTQDPQLRFPEHHLLLQQLQQKKAENPWMKIG